MRNAVFILLTLVGLLAVVAPYVSPLAGIEIPGTSSFILSGFGVFLLVLVGVLAVLFNLYVKTKANEAFVRTGLGGQKVIMNGGALVVPMFHEVVRITLETLKLQVNRTGQSALVTKDKLRADVVAEFYVKVMPGKDTIVKASQSLGAKMNNVEQVKELVDDKLTSALRSVAAKRTLEELHTDRDAFVLSVQESVNEDLAHNGLSLEAVTISKLDQTDVQFLSETNIFDAEGRKTIAAITEVAKTERNRLEKEGERARTAQDVTTRKEVLALEQDRETAEAKQASAIAAERAAADREAQEKTIEAQRLIELAGLRKGREIELMDIDNKKAAEVARIQQKQEQDLALEQQKQAVELASEKREQSVAEAQKLKAAEEAELQGALAERQRKTEEVETVKITAEAERAKQHAVIGAQAKAESEYVSKQREADADAYKVKAEAEAKKAAADADAEAKIKAANADKAAELAKVEARKAGEMVPVEVDRGRVEVDRERVAVDRDRLDNVTIPELRARDEHGKSAQDFELDKLRITQTAEVEIARANATAAIVGKIELKAFGTPDDVHRMTRAYMQGESINSTLEGLGSKLSGDDILRSVGDFLGDAMKNLTEKAKEAEEVVTEAAPAAAQPPSPPEPKSRPKPDKADNAKS